MAEFYERFTVEEELKFFRDMELQTSRVSSYEKTATPSLAQTVGDIYQKYSSANPGVLLAVAQGIDNGLMTSDLADKLLQDTIQTEMDETASYGIGGKDGKTSWYERNVFNNVKTGVKYTTAGLNTLYEFGQGALAKTGAALAGQGSFLDVFDDGWFISTSLGSLIENGDESGYGWFIGGKANELQAQRARDYRGEVSGHAWTLGRGIAHVFFQPNYEQNAVADGLENAAFSILSGGVDAMFALKTPALPGLGKIANFSGSFKGAVGMRVVDGLATWESAAILPSRVARWMDSTAGRKTIEFLAEKVDTVDKAMAVFPNSNTVWWQNIINTDTVQDMRNLLEQGLGMRTPDVGLAPRRIQDFNVGYWNGAKMRLNQYDSYVPRLFNRMITPVYDRDVVLAFGNDRDVAQSMKNLSNSMVAFGVKSERRQKLLADFLDAYNNNRGALAGVSKQYRNIMEEALTANGAPKAAVNSMLDGWIEFGNNLKYGVSKIENDQIVGDNFGAWVWGTDGQRYWAPTSTAGALPEVAKHTLVLPDPRRVRRILNDDPVFKHMFSTTGWALGKTSWFDPADYGKARLPGAAIEAFQQEVWRPFVLMTGGYLTRNMSDSALRLRMQTDLLNGAFHPLDYILLAAGKKGLGDVEGITFELSRNKILEAKGEFGEAMNTTIRELDQRAVAAQERWTGLWEFAPKDNTQDFIKGVADEISLLAKDEIAMRIALGEPTKDIVDFLTTTPRGQQIVRDLGEMWKNVEMVPVGGGAPAIRSADFTGVNGAASLRRYIETYMAPRVRSTTGGYPSLIDAIAKGEFTDANGNLVKAFLYTSGADPRYIGTNPEFFDEIARIASDPANTLKDIYKKRVELDPRKIRGRYEGRPGLERVGEFTDKMVDMFFGHMYTKNEALLNRSPAFRRYYYNEINVLIDNLQPAEAPRIFDNIMKAAADLKVDVSTAAKQRRFVRRYLGDKELADKIIDLKRGKIATNGQRTLGEIDSIAKGYALDSTKELFYNAASRSNFTDIMRIVAPFGKAWAEVMQSWLKIATANPNQFRKSAIMVKGLRDSDPEGDGKGFFYRNPTNGEYYFNFPWSEQLAPLFGVYGGATIGFFAGGLPGAVVGGAVGARVGEIAQRQIGGVSPEAIFPARSLNMGTQIVPGFGPVVQMSAEKILGNNPKYDDWVAFFSPYGFAGIEQAFPAWIRKSYEAVFGNPENNRVLGDI